MLEFARSLAEEGAALIRAACERGSPRTLDHKGRRDLVTDVDRRIEERLAQRIRAACPEDAILGEEGVHQAGRSGRVWILDPLDGTTNFVHGHPMVCVSVALADGYGGPPGPDAPRDACASGYFDARALPRVLAGVVAAPLLRETFRSERGGGAWLGDRRLRVSGETDLREALLATGFAYRLNEVRVDNLDNFCRLTRVARGIRRGGAAALDLCYVAAARFDAFWELYLKPWDVAAGLLIVEEAGGRVTDFADGARALEGVEVIASNVRLHEAVCGQLDRADPAWSAGERARLEGRRE
jgi:myo-inositol-1(or 4)-monophosphatase